MEFNENGFVNRTFWGEVKCLFGSHYWMCLTPTNQYGNYVKYKQHWLCRRCQKSKITYN